METVAGGWKCFFWRIGILHLPINGLEEHYWKELAIGMAFLQFQRINQPSFETSNCY
jgi:hypothetical protein